MATRSHLNNSLARRYYRQMKAGYADSIVRSQPSRTAADDINAYIRAGAARNPEGTTGETSRGGVPRGGNPTNPGTWLIDVLSQPAYAMQENIKDIAEVGGKIRRGGLNGGDIVEALTTFDDFGSRNAKESGLELAMGDPEYYNNLMARAGEKRRFEPGERIGPLSPDPQDNIAQKVGKGAAGFAASIAMDPLTYITLGSAGAATKGLGTLVKGGVEAGAARSAIGKGLETAGAQAIRADAAINAVPGKVVKAIKGKVRPSAVTAAEKVAAQADEVVSPATSVEPSKPVEIPVEPNIGPTIAAPRVEGPMTPQQDDLLRQLLGDTARRGPVTISAPQRMLKSTVDDTVVPYSAAEARKNVVPRYTEDQWARVISPEGRALTPYAQEAVTQTSKVGQDIVEELTPAAVKKEAAKQADDALDSVVNPIKPRPVDDPIDPEEVAAFVKHFGDKVNIKVHYGKGGIGAGSGDTTKTLTEWISRIQDPGRPFSAAVNTTVKKALSDGIKAAREGTLPAGAARRARPRPAAATEAAPGPSVPAESLNVLEEAQRIAEKGGTSRNWVTKPPAERARIRKRYQRLLENEHFEYLYENQSRADWTEAKKQADFVSRLARIRSQKGKAISQPRYVEFYQQQIVHTPGQNFEAVMEGNAKLLSERPQAFNDALSKVTPAAEIMEQADTSIGATVAREAERIYLGQGLDDVSKSILRHRLGGGDQSVPGQMWDGLREDFPFQTNIQKSAKDTEVFMAGHAVNREAYNGKAQTNIFRDLLYEANESLKAQGLLKSGYRGAQAKMDYIVPRLEKIEEFLRAHGIEPIGGTTKNGVPISLGDMFKVLETTEAGRSFVRGRIFGGAIGMGPKGVKESPGTIHVDSLLRVMGAVIEKIDATAINAAKTNVDQLEAIARSVAGTIRGKKIPADDIRRIVTDNGRRPISSGARPKSQGAEVVKIGQGFPVDVKDGKPYYGPYSAQVVKELENVLFNSKEYGKADFRVINALAQTVQARSAAYGIRFGDNVRQLSEKSMREVFNLLDENPSLTEVIDTLGDTDALVSAVAKTKILRPSSEELLAAQARINEDLNDVLSLWDRKNIEAFKGIAKGAVKDAATGGTRTATNKAMMKVMENAEDEIRSTVTLTPPEVAIFDMEIADITTASRRVGLWATNNFVPAKVVNASGKAITTNRFHDAFRQVGSLSRNISSEVNKALSRINRQFDKETLAAGYKHLQNGMRGQVAPEIRAAAEALKPINSMFYDAVVKGKNTEAKGVLMDFFGRGFDLKHVEHKMHSGYFGIPENLQFNWEKVAKFTDPHDRINELHRQWVNMDVKDPLDYLSRLDATIANLAGDVSISQRTWKKMDELGLVSRTPKPEFGTLKGVEANYITRYFPAEEGTYYVHKSVIPELQKMDRLLRESVDFGDGAFGKFMKGYTPILNMWKSGMTIWRLGHHMRNLVGDASLSFLADGVKDPRYYYRAVKFLADRKSYDTVDMLEMLRGVPPTKLRDTRYVLKARLGNGTKPLDIPDEEFYDAMYRRGVIKDFRQQEDLMEASQIPRPIRAVQERMQLTGGRAKAAVGRASEARDDFVRLGHALHLLENKPALFDVKQKSYKSLDELYDAIAARVNQVHPDGTDLAGFERKWMRNLFPFYSWMRKAIPLVVESAAQRPGRITVAPKAMYAMQMQMGIESDSMSDPFPEDQLFPSWLTDQISGPAYQGDDGSYYGINPGLVDSDLINTFLTGNGLNATLDMINPMLKLPIELQTGQTLGQGIQTPGADPMQYIGSQIPGISHVQSLFGKDVLGSAGTLAAGEGFDDTLAVERGNRDNMEEENFLNYFLGLGVQDMSTQSAQNAARIEKRDEAAMRKGGK